LLQSPPELGDLGGGSDGNLDFSDNLLNGLGGSDIRKCLSISV